MEIEKVGRRGRGNALEYLVEEFHEDICGEVVPSRANLLRFLASFVISRGNEILECRQVQPPKRTNSKELGRNACLHVVMLS